MKEKQPTITGYKRRKLERTEDYNKNVKYWVQRDCTACMGTGYYDTDGSPDCGGCEGTGKQWDRPDYSKGLTDSESLVGATLTLKVGDLVDLIVYVNKRREVIYQYYNVVDPDNKVRTRARLHFGYTEEGRAEDWLFHDKYGKRYYLGDFSEVKK